MSVPQDATKNHPTTTNKEQKVIVLSMKNMVSVYFFSSYITYITYRIYIYIFIMSIFMQIHYLSSILYY